MSERPMDTTTAAEAASGPSDDGFAQTAEARHRKSRAWKIVFGASTVVGIIALAALLYNVTNSAFGLVAWEDEVPRDSLAVDGVAIEDMDAETLLAVLEENLSAGRIRAMNAEAPLAERGRGELEQLVFSEIVEPSAVATYHLVDSLLRRGEIQAEVAEEHPDATLAFHSWVSADFVTNTQSTRAEVAGVRTAILGSLWVILITIVFAFPLGVGAAVYLEEYADHTKRINQIIQTNINNLAGVPSIIYGILGLAIFVRFLAPIMSGALFGIENESGRTVLAAGLTLGLLILPLIIINSQEAVRAVPSSIRQASFGLGATKWQTIWNHVLPYAIPGILTGTILSISRAIGETAPLVVIGASTYIVTDPTGPFSKFTALPIQIYQWTARPQPEFRNIAAAAIIVLLTLLLMLNATAVFLRNRYSVRY